MNEKRKTFSKEIEILSTVFWTLWERAKWVILEEGVGRFWNECSNLVQDCVMNWSVECQNSECKILREGEGIDHSSVLVHPLPTQL